LYQYTNFFRRLFCENIFKISNVGPRHKSIHAKLGIIGSYYVCMVQWWYLERLNLERLYLGKTKSQKSKSQKTISWKDYISKRLYLKKTICQNVVYNTGPNVVCCWTPKAVCRWSWH
jgi:hypothetical protein